MPLRVILSLLPLLLLCTCDPAPKTPAQNTTATAAPTSPATDYISYPSITVDRLEYLWENATYMDATFYRMPVSINQNELPQIRSTIQTVGQEPAELPRTCQPMGRIWFQVDGKNVEEAEIYFSDGCYGYVWMENGQAAYSNKMTQDGLEFYANIIRSVQQNTGGQ